MQACKDQEAAAMTHQREFRRYEAQIAEYAQTQSKLENDSKGLEKRIQDLELQLSEAKQGIFGPHPFYPLCQEYLC